MSILKRLVSLAIVFSSVFSVVAAAQSGGEKFALQQVMSAPFNSDLIAAPVKNRLAWLTNVEGKRNIWVATPSGSDRSYVSRQITQYASDDGQEISDLEWSPDAESIVYVRGGSTDNLEKMSPNPAHLPQGAEQDVWLVSLDGSAPRMLGKGRSPAFSPNGDAVAWVLNGQVWFMKTNDPAAKPAQLLRTLGRSGSLQWSPDGNRLAFVSNRRSHSFIGVYSFPTNTLNYLDPSTDHDRSPMWSPDGRQIAFIRIPYSKEENFDGDQRFGQPWSIRIADVGTGEGHQIWKANAGPGSVFRGVDADHQVFWGADDHLVFPWEGDGWTHLYAVSTQGGAATLLTPGSFEVKDVSISPDGKTMVYSSNQNDIDRRHVWKVAVSASSPVELTPGTGIETVPVITSDDQTVAVLRSDARIPIRPAILTNSGKLQDLAPQTIPASFPAASMVVPQQVIFNAADGMRIHGQLFLPANSDNCVRHPAIVFVHGGSQRQMLLGWHPMGYYSNSYAMNQYLVSRGYIVLSVNYRSGIGYGLNFREALDYGATGASEFRDVEGAGLYLRSRCDVEPTHIGIWGGSWGGFLTAIALARASDLFAAGVDMSGVHDWNIDHPGNFSISDTAPDPNARWQLAWRSSPLASVKRWHSPVLLIQGDDDREVPFLQSVQLAAALRQQGVAFQELIFPDEGHDFLLHRTWVAAYAAGAKFFDKQLKSTAQNTGTVTH
ncbi:MAG TPA: prolyl oligopeptidase family serine peptidase [Acidobacteriaceae bacterium]|nr:prolyl oligopeptidase family serine peptidase [Acidobacteriaceae bacterium]